MRTESISVELNAILQLPIHPLSFCRRYGRQGHSEEWQIRQRRINKQKQHRICQTFCRGSYSYCCNFVVPLALNHSYRPSLSPKSGTWVCMRRRRIRSGTTLIEVLFCSVLMEFTNYGYNQNWWLTILRAIFEITTNNNVASPARQFHSDFFHFVICWKVDNIRMELVGWVFYFSDFLFFIK